MSALGAAQYATAYTLQSVALRKKLSGKQDECGRKREYIALPRLRTPLEAVGLEIQVPANAWDALGTISPVRTFLALEAKILHNLHYRHRIYVATKLKCYTDTELPELNGYYVLNAIRSV